MSDRWLHRTSSSTLTLATPLALVAIAELARLVGAGGCAGGHNGAVQAGFGDDVDLDGGVTTGVVDVAGVDLLNGHDVYMQHLVSWGSLVARGASLEAGDLFHAAVAIEL